MINRAIFQIIVFIAITALIGISLTYVNIPIFYGILIGIVAQFGINYAFVTVLDAVVALKNKKLENERIREFSLQGLEVTCPCSLKKTEFVPIVLNTNNTYKCDHCQKNVSVYIVPETALVTETIANTDTINIPALNALTE
jgi:hypothetical protein